MSTMMKNGDNMFVFFFVMMTIDATKDRIFHESETVLQTTDLLNVKIFRRQLLNRKMARTGTTRK